MFKTRTLLYKVIGGLVLVIALSFSFGGFVLTKSKPTVSTKLGTSIQNGNERLIFEHANYYKSSQLLEVELAYNGNLSNANEQLKITTFNGASKTKIPATLEQINLNYYVVFVPNVLDLKQILIEFATTSISEKGKQTLKTISVTPKNAQMKGKFLPQTTSYYERHYLSDLVSQAEQRTKQIDSSIAKFQHQITQFQTANARLNTQLAYETKSEQAQTQSEMADNQSQIDGLNEQIKSEQGAKKGLDDKIAMLKSKGAN